MHKIAQRRTIPNRAAATVLDFNGNGLDVKVKVREACKAVQSVPLRPILQARLWKRETMTSSFRRITPLLIILLALVAGSPPVSYTHL